MARLAVRQAIEYGVDKRAVRRVAGGPAAATIISTVIPPGSLGYRGFDLYPSASGAGNPVRCRQLLTRAGYGGGLAANYWYPDDSLHAAMFRAIAASLRGCGIVLTGKAEPAARLFADLRDARANGAPGTFDIAQSDWLPDWFGDNGRAIIAPLLETGCGADTVNYGCYSNPRMDALIGRAETAPTPAAAAALWHQADLLAMRDAAIVPLLSRALPSYSSARVRQYCAGSCPPGIAVTPAIGGPDVTSVWLARG
jgi:peptide/nickel transport system substrate-binding protein